MVTKKQNRFLHAIKPDHVKIEMGIPSVAKVELDYENLKNRKLDLYTDPKTRKKHRLW